MQRNLINETFVFNYAHARSEARLVLHLVVTNEREINRLLEIVTIDVTNVSHKPGIYIHTHTKQCKSTVYSRKVTKLLFAI